jgi:hypothetical protein
LKNKNSKTTAMNESKNERTSHLRYGATSGAMLINLSTNSPKNCFCIRAPFALVTEDDGLSHSISDKSFIQKEQT